MTKTISEDIHAAVDQVFAELQSMAAHMSPAALPQVTRAAHQLNRIKYLADQVKEQR